MSASDIVVTALEHATDTERLLTGSDREAMVRIAKAALPIAEAQARCVEAARALFKRVEPMLQGHISGKEPRELIAARQALAKLDALTK